MIRTILGVVNPGIKGAFCAVNAKRGRGHLMFSLMLERGACGAQLTSNHTLRFEEDSTDVETVGKSIADYGYPYFLASRGEAQSGADSPVPPHSR